MARERSAAQWDRLTPTYRDRLVRNGVTRDEYLSGAKLSSARGQSKEAEHKHQRYIVEKYGPKKRPEGMTKAENEITPAMLRNARKHYGDAWVTERLNQLKIDYQKSARGEFPYQGNVRRDLRTGSNQEYSDLANRSNTYAAFWWYKGVFGKHGAQNGTSSGINVSCEDQYSSRRSCCYSAYRGSWRGPGRF